MGSIKRKTVAVMAVGVSTKLLYVGSS